MSTIFRGLFFLVPVEHNNGWSISSCDVVCVHSTNVIVGCTPLPRYSVHQGTAIQYILSFSSLAQQCLRHRRPYSICKCRFVSRPHNISGFEDCWGDNCNSCRDESLTQQLWVDLYCCIVDFDSRWTECDSLVFFLKLCCNTFYCAVDVNIFSPTSFAWSTFTLIPALINVAMLRKLQLSLDGFRDSRNSNSSHESVISFPCLDVVKYKCCSLVLYCTPVSCCIALFTSTQTGCAINQTRRWFSVMPRPLVKFPLVFTLRMTTCSMTRSVESPAQNRSDLRTTWSPWSKCLDASGWVS